MKLPRFKVMTILGTRPEIIRLSRVIAGLDDSFKHILVYTNQSYDYELSGIFFREMKIRKPDYMLRVQSPTIGGQIANIMSQTEKVLDTEKPDALLVLGDTNSALSSILAKRKKILLFHMEAGNRCFDWDVPEEINRRIVDHISDYNLAYTEHARRYLIAEGIPAQSVIVTGSPLTEVFAYYAKKIQSSSAMRALHLRPRGYFLVSCHREENIENKERMENLFTALRTMRKMYKKRIIVSLHPRTGAIIPQKKWEQAGIELHKPFGFFDYAKLEKNATCVLTDSGTIQEESAVLGFAAIQIRYSTERPEAFDAGSIILCGLQSDSIMQSVDFILASQHHGPIVMPKDYVDTHVSDKVTRFILGTIGIHNEHERCHL